MAAAAEDSAPAGADAALLALLAEADRLTRERDVLQASVAELRPDDPRPVAAWAGIMALEARWRAATRQAGGIPAHTRDGVCAKARLVRSEMADSRGGEPRSAWEALLWSLLDDVLGDAGRG